MAHEEKGKLVEQYSTSFAKGDAATLERVIDDSFKASTPPIPGIKPDKKTGIAMSKLFHKAFPDLSKRYSHWVIQGDRVAVRIVRTGTHKGDFMGIAATDKRSEAGTISIVTGRIGKIVADLTDFDALGPLTTLGAIPELAPPS